MKKIHAKSPCCGVPVVKCGERRRQCVFCKRTWRVRQKKRGRDRLRGNVALLLRFLDHVIGSSKARAEEKETSVRTLQRTMARARDLFCRITPWPTLPRDEQLILLADATPKRIRGRWYTVFCMLIRRPDESVAWIAPPVIVPGLETRKNWDYALATLPEAQLSSVRAMICDGHRGLLDFAKRHNWLIQRCQFHLIAFIQGRRSRWGKSLHQEEGKRIYATVRRVLDAPVDADITKLRIDVDNLALSTTSRELRKALMGFATNTEYYRTHLYHPELHLPRTNNASEACIGTIESLLKRIRGVSNTDSLSKWIEALVKHKKKIVCNGFSSTKLLS